MHMFFAALVATAMVSGSSDPVEIDPAQMENLVVYDDEMDPSELKKLEEMANQAFSEIAIDNETDASDLSEDKE